MRLHNSWLPRATTHSRYRVRLRSHAALFEQHGTLFMRERPERSSVPIGVVRRGVCFGLSLEERLQLACQGKDELVLPIPKTVVCTQRPPRSTE
ncbi:unnamed protein product [Chondrus crispus]|uniref:Uncharacterized protein n=1 Tax=Chondrus crispus TaxID=2769 RepID=R7QGG2_CHOCR|nr:unnamed protein product [Chondrus crispus]CDF36863.1 unnamed protein product [Chondrus crispus]|eukprot:XP_005716682.1 unnamed protein product [Chondrus crispus]